MKRRRNAILAALELLRSRHVNLTISDVLVFAAVARGLRELGEIARETGLSKETVSRCARSMLSQRSAHHLPPSADLLAMEISPRNNRTRLFSLNDQGRMLLTAINRLIADADPIGLSLDVAEPEPERTRTTLDQERELAPVV
jgi:DNA-binding MarR family transcriptional regulator